MLAPNVIIPYDGTHASIPAGFTRETSLDGKYPKATANGIDPNVTGGASTHTHTSPTHTHTVADHTHTGTTGARINGGGASRAPSTTGLTPLDHSHNYTTGGVSSGGVTSADAVTYGAVSNDPPYYTVIFIKSASYVAIPVSGMVFSTATTRPEMTFHSASAGKFLKGAGTGANAGGTGGSTSNVHDISHSHTANTHAHGASNTAASNQQQGEHNSGGANDSLSSHTHSLSVASGTASVTAFSGTITCDEVVQPEYKTLNTFKNDGGSSTPTAIGDIALWLGSLASIPTNWRLCDGTNSTPDMRGYYIKANATATTSSTGGSNTHTHAAKAHAHTSENHTHSVSFGNYAGTINGIGGGVDITNGTHGHSTATSNVTNASYGNANTTANSESNEPEYRTVAYIQMTSHLATGQPLLAIIENTQTS